MNELFESQEFKKALSDLIDVMYNNDNYPLSFLKAPEVEYNEKFEWKIMGK